LDANNGGIISLGGNYDGTNRTTFAQIKGLKDNNTSGQYGGYLSFLTRTNGQSPTERLRIDSTGVMGLKVTPDSWENDASLAAIQLSGYGALHNYYNNVSLSFNAYQDSSSTSKYLTTDEAARYTMDSNGNHVWYTAASGTIDTNITFTERLRITSSGDVGIGTDDPESFKLKIQGSTLSFGNLLTDARQVYYTNSYNTNGWGNDGLWHTVCPHTLANNSVYLVSLVWDWGGSVGQPYYLATQTLYSTVNGANGTGSENELTPLASTHTGSSGARINVRTVAASGGSNTSGLQVNFTGFSSGANSYIIVKCWRLMYNTRSI